MDEAYAEAGICNIDLSLSATLELHCPAFDEVRQVLQDGLAQNFSHVEVRVTECPNLTEAPFLLTAPGICGSPRIADVGGPPYLTPLPQLDKVYDLADICSLSGLSRAFVIGAGAGPHRHVGVNSELIANVKCLGDGCAAIQSRTCKIFDSEYLLEPLDTTTFSLLGNFFISEGKQGKVIEVKAKKRKGPENLISCMRKSLAGRYGSDPVGLGGVFLIETGKAKIHVMPDFSTDPLNSDEDVNKWLKFFDMSAPLVCLTGECVSYDPGLDLRVEHTHCFSRHGDGGHYHYDTTPDEVSYHGYFNLADVLYRIDQPPSTHSIGRD